MSDHVLGIVILCLVGVGIVGATVAVCGWRTAAIIWGTSAVVNGLILIGLLLL